MKKKFFTLFFALAASVGTIFAESSGTCGANLTWTLSDEGVLTISGTGAMEDFFYYYGAMGAEPATPWKDNLSAIKSIVIESGVTSIGDYAFWYCSSLTSVTIPNSVTSIGKYAFAECSSLTSVTIGNSVTSIGNGAFWYCSSLTSVTIPNSVTSIGNGAFSDCSSLPVIDNLRYADTYLVEAVDRTRSTYTIKDGTRWIGEDAFSGCSSLTSVTIPNSVTSIGDYAFWYCSSLTSVTIPNSVTSIGNKAFYGCSGLISVTLNSNTIVGKDYENNSNIKSIFGEQVTEYILGDEITSIGNYAFYYCSSLTSVTIGNSVTSIGDYAFNECSGLTSVTIGNSVTSIGGNAFYGCTGLTSVTIGNSVTSIGRSAFKGCKIASVNYTGTMEEWCNKSWSPSVISSGYQLLMNGVLQENVIIPNSVTSIGNYAFFECTGLTSVTIPNSVTSIGEYAFSECTGLTSVTIPNSVTSIGRSAFQYCYRLTSVILGTSVRVIEEHAFYDCIAIKTITCYSMRPPTVNNDAFWSVDYSTIVYVPADYLNTYKMHDFWGVYDVRPIGAATTETTEVKVEPTATTADIAWPVVENAATYELVIKDKSGNVVCTLIFNANGQLTQIAFNAPARDNASQAAGFSFTVTGLEEGTSYDLTITAKDGNGTTLDEKTIAFSTSGWTGVDALQAGELRSSKVMRDGQVLIMRGGKMYNLQGVEMK